MKKANKIFHDFLSLIYPDKCPICKRIIYEGGGVCKECDVKFKAETYLPAPDCSRENRKCDCRPETDFDKTIYKYIHLSQYNLSKDDPVGKGLVLYCKEHNVKAVYDYEDGVCLKVYELADGKSAETTVYDGRNKLRCTAKVSRNGNDYEISVKGDCIGTVEICGKEVKFAGDLSSALTI